MEINNHTLRYLIHFLIGEDLSDNIISSIGYTNDCKQFDLYKIVIIHFKNRSQKSNSLIRNSARKPNHL